MPPLVCHAASSLSRTVSLALADSDLTASGYRLLGYLSTGKSAAKTLAAKLAVSRPSITAAVDWLEPRGYVTRQLDPDDRRHVSIAITDKGSEALAEADEMVGARISTVLGSLDRRELQWITNALERVYEAMNEYRESTAPTVTPSGGDA